MLVCGCLSVFVWRENCPSTADTFTMCFSSVRSRSISGFMNAVDTGWVTDEDPAAISARKQEMHDFQPPLDIVDGAARICDPFFSGLLTGQHVWGKFLKDYAPCAW